LTSKSKDDFKNVYGLAFFDKKASLLVTPFQDAIDCEKMGEGRTDQYMSYFA
jgi:hypothetical protein